MEDRFGDDFDDEPYEEDPIEEAISNCSGSYYRGLFVCGAVGSEDCDFECPFSHLIGTKESRDAE